MNGAALFIRGFVDRIAEATSSAVRSSSLQRRRARKSASWRMSSQLRVVPNSKVVSAVWNSFKAGVFLLHPDRGMNNQLAVQSTSVVFHDRLFLQRFYRP